MLTFVHPTEANRADVEAFYAEFNGRPESVIGSGVSESFDTWLASMHSRITAVGLPEGFVQEAFYLCYNGPDLVGVLNLKFSLTPYLLDYGGHIGYAVRPSRQGHGFATQMLRQACEIAHGMGMERLLLVCDDDNYASEKVILRNGGVYENTLHDDEEDVFVKRFWIIL